MVSIPPPTVRNMSRELLEEFLIEYRNSPCLWKTKSGDYLNKELKAEAYRRLEAICQREHPDADRDFVWKKINSLRGSYRRERHRVNTKINYVPQLWFYKWLHFTTEQENDFVEPKLETDSDDKVKCWYFWILIRFHSISPDSQIQQVNDSMSKYNDTVSPMIYTAIEYADDENDQTNNAQSTAIKIEIPSAETDADCFEAQLFKIEIHTDIDNEFDEIIATDAETVEAQTQVSSELPVAKRRRITMQKVATWKGSVHEWM